MNKNYENMTMATLLDLDQEVEKILRDSGFHCLGCPSSQFETLKDACEIHGVSLQNTLRRLEDYFNE